MHSELPTYLSTNKVLVFFFREGENLREKKTKEKFEIYFFQALSFFFPEKRLWRPTSKKVLVFFFLPDLWSGKKKLDLPTYILRKVPKNNVPPRKLKN